MTAPTLTKLGSTSAPAYIGRVFQDPHDGTAATMQIEKNLAWPPGAASGRGLRIGITKAEQERYRELLKSLDLGLEDRLTARVGLLSGGQRRGTDPAYGYHEQAQAPAAG